MFVVHIQTPFGCIETPPIDAAHAARAVIHGEKGSHAHVVMHNSWSAPRVFFYRQWATVLLTIALLRAFVIHKKTLRKRLKAQAEITRTALALTDPAFSELLSSHPELAKLEVMS